MGALDRVFRSRRPSQERPLAAIIAGLWRNGEQGVWYDVEGFRDAWNSVGSELTPAVAPVFGEASVVSPGVYRIYSSAGAFSSVGAVASATAVIGRKYIVSFNVDSITTLGGGLVVESVENPAVTTLGPKSFLVTAANTSLHIKRNSSACDLQISGVSAKEWPGRDSCTLYQDASGTLPAYMPGRGQVDPPVGLLLDKRKGLERGPELLTNGDFTSTAEWVESGVGVALSAAAGELQITSGSPLGAYQQPNKFIVGRWYVVTGQIRVGSAASVSIRTVAGGSSLGTTVAESQVVTSSAFVAVSYIFLATNTANAIYLRVGTTNSTAFFKSISVRELPGNHAYQATTTSRPTLSARYNLLTNTSFAGAIAGAPGTVPTGWVFGFATGEITAVTPLGPDFAIQIAASSSRLIFTQQLTAAPNVAYSHWIDVLETTAITAINFIALTAPPSGATMTYWFNGEPITSSTIISSPGRLEMRMLVGSTGGSYYVRFGVGCSGNTTGIATIARPDVRVTGDGVGLPPYQRVVDASTYDTAGFPLYLKFDGVDDSLLTADIDFSTVSSAIAVSTIRKLSDASRGIVFELGGTGYSSPGSFNQEIMWFSANVSTSYSGVTGNATSTYSCIAPFSAVMSSAWNLSAPLQTFRVNGVLRSTSTVAVGGGMFQKAPLFIGRRNNASVPFNGRLYSLLIRGAATPDATIAKVERHLNSKARAY